MRGRYDELFAEGRQRILAGNHQCDTPPVEGGRWPVTILSRLPETASSVLHDLTLELAALAGPGHFLTGVADSAHLTWRALEGYRAAAGPLDELAVRSAAAVERTAAVVPAFRLRFTGLTLASASVMAQMEPDGDDDSWLALMRCLEFELGEAAWFERGYQRTITYTNLVHFTGPIEQPEALVDFVDSRRDLPPLRVAVDHLELVRFHTHRDELGVRIRPTTWARTALRSAVTVGS